MLMNYNDIFRRVLNNILKKRKSVEMIIPLIASNHS